MISIYRVRRTYRIGLGIRVDLGIRVGLELGFGGNFLLPIMAIIHTYKISHPI